MTCQVSLEVETVPKKNIQTSASRNCLVSLQYTEVMFKLTSDLVVLPTN